MNLIRPTMLVGMTIWMHFHGKLHTFGDLTNFAEAIRNYETEKKVTLSEAALAFWIFDDHNLISQTMRILDNDTEFEECLRAWRWREAE